MIAIIDYGMGNLRSVQKAFEAVGHQAVVTREPQVIGDASHVVLPGVGAFADCMSNLDRYGLIDPIRRGIAAGKPFLGICLGLQLLFSESEEFGLHKGLDIVPGRVRRFPFGQAAGRDSRAAGLKVPHMGWNALTVMRETPSLRGIETGAHLYFVHSYYVEPRDPSIASTVTEYGVPFVSSIWRDNVFACQFHPEKSQTVGLRIIKNFGEWRP
ncbi:MAG TPA: imidazole glycerol phosphate synthase subunit HisH [Nitrospiraceae bacterium]|jgi:glutamine amidotransferase|nr:imidazole glycerol phosphate synthase subunit HisH [Nitrospiraceae bacterium]